MKVQLVICRNCGEDIYLHSEDDDCPHCGVVYRNGKVKYHAKPSEYSKDESGGSESSIPF
jgi:hypothetical protein